MKNILKKIITIKILILIILVNFSFFSTENVSAAINQQVNYQGRLLDSAGDAVVDGSYDIDFALYTTATLGSAIWTESQTVTTQDGLFSVMLGSVSALGGVNFNQTLYLGLNVEADGEMTPRKILGSVPTAFESDKLDGISSEQFLRNDVLNSTNSATTSFSLLQEGAGKIMELFRSGMESVFSVLSNGNVGIGTSTPSTIFEISGSDPVLTIDNTSFLDDDYQIRSGVTADTFEIYNKTNAYTMLAIEDEMLMIGTTTNILGNSSRLFVYGGNNGANIDVMGEAVSGRDQALLELESANFASSFESTSLRHFGELSLGTTLGFSNSSGLGVVDFSNVMGIIKTADSDPIIFGTNNTERMRLAADGNFGIGTTTPSQKLSVSGNAIVDGYVTSSYFTSTSTTATSTLPNVDTTNIEIAGRLYDGSSSAGTNGYILQTTGTGIQWVATSSLGISGGLTDYGIGDDVTSGTSGSILFVDSSGDLAQDNSAFFWDATNQRLRLGTSTAAVVIGDVSGDSRGGYAIDIQKRRSLSTNVASGISSIAIGDSVIASAENATAFGVSNTASGLNSISIGFTSVASGNDSISLGTYSNAIGNSAVAIGYEAIANDINSVAIGNNSWATGNNTIAIGIGARANAVGASVFGGNSIGAFIENNVAYSTMIGPNATSSIHILNTGEVKLPFVTSTSTTATSTLPNLTSTNVVATNLSTTNSTTTNSTITGRLYDGSSSAGTSGYVLQTTGTGISWVATSSLGFVDTGITSYGIGDAVTSGTQGSILFVDSSGNLAQDNSSFYYDSFNSYLRLGTSTDAVVVGNIEGDARGLNAVDIQSYRSDAQSVASGFGSVAVGYDNEASGMLSVAVGTSNVSTSISSTAVGVYTSATADTASVFGFNSSASYEGSTAIGWFLQANNIGASVFGGGAQGAFNYMTNSVANSTLIGPNSTSSIHILSTGEVKLPYLTSTSTTATSTLPNLTSTNIVTTNLTATNTVTTNISATNSTTTNSAITGRLYDGSSSSGTNGYILQTTGSGISWVATSSLGFATTSPGGSNTQVQFNDGGVFGGDSGFTYNKTTDTLSVNGGVEGVTGDYSYSLTSLSGLSLADDSVSKTSNYNASSISFDSSTFLSTNYLNFTSTIGSSGYGIRNNAGTIEFKNSAGDWTSFDALEPSQPIYAIGSVSAYSGSSLPSGWLWADGSAISRTTYADLFALIGTTYGVGDGSTTFNLPDLRGRTIAGKDNMDNSEGSGGGDAARLTSGSKAAIDGDTLGASGGVQEHLLTWEESGLKPHSHTYYDRYNNTITRQNGTNNTGSASITGVTTNTAANTAEDADEAHTNVQPTLVLNYIIRYTHAEANAAFWSKSGSDLYYATGSIGIGTTTPQRALHVAISTDGAPVRFQDSNGYCEINPTSTTWTCTSDERLKENILNVASSTPDLYEKMLQLRPVTFEWRTDETNSQRVGFIAQEVEVLFPEFVTTDSETGLKSVSYGSFIPYIIFAIQELAEKVDLMFTKFDELTSHSISTIGGVITKLTIGSSEKPTGITLFDEATGDPYCVSVKNGNMVTKFGECGVDEQEHSNSNSGLSDLTISNVDNENNTVEIIDESTDSNTNEGVIVEIEENPEQDIDLNTEPVSEVVTEENVVEISETDEDTTFVETNQASGSVEIPVE